MSGILVMLTCEAGTQFDYVLKRCVWYEEAVCLPDTTTAKTASSTATATSTSKLTTTSFKSGKFFNFNPKIKNPIIKTRSN